MANGTTVAVAVGVAVRDGPGEALVVAGRGHGDHGGAGMADSARFAEVSVTVGAMSVIVIDDLCVGLGGPVGNLHREVVLRVSKSRSSASLTVIAPCPS